MTPFHDLLQKKFGLERAIRSRRKKGVIRLRILYLGTDPSRYVHAGDLTHYPVIRTILCTSLDEVLKHELKSCTHWLFTSPNAVRHWFALATPNHFAKYIAIGTSTAAALEKLGVRAVVAPFATQEGVIALLDTLGLQKARIGWPRSSRARSVLSDYLTQRGIDFISIDLYKTISQRLEPVPDLNLFDEIVFTSSSTVEAFLEIFGQIPLEKKIVAIGPITYTQVNAKMSR